MIVIMMLGGGICVQRGYILVYIPYEYSFGFVYRTGSTQTRLPFWLESSEKNGDED